MTLYSLVTAVPLPGVTWPVGEEVCCPLVLDSLRKPQEHTGVIISGSIGCAADKNQSKRISLQKKKNTNVLYGHDYITKIVFPATSPSMSGADFQCLSEGCLNGGWKNNLEARGCLG